VQTTERIDGRLGIRLNDGEVEIAVLLDVVSTVVKDTEFFISHLELAQSSQVPDGGLKMHKRRYRSIRIPAHVYERVLKRLSVK
jgi:hypothetical protein